MLKLRDGIVELYKRVSTSVPADVEDAIKSACASEEGALAKESLSIMLENIRLARQTSRPVCQDTGIPFFHVKVPRGLSYTEIRNTIREATVKATEKVPLRQNAVDVITEKNSGDNTGAGFPVIHLEDTTDGSLKIDLVLRGADCENIGQTYRLPLDILRAESDLEGVRRCVLHAIQKAQGRGCPPYVIGIGIGASIDQASALARNQLLRRISDRSEHPVIAELESRLLNEINQLGIGAMGLGGKTTATGVKIGVNHRHVSSYVVDVSVCCWLHRRGRLIW